ncbi:MAG: hypothetical protein QM736_02760 [Vicinamibacterales bacterium]
MCPRCGVVVEKALRAQAFGMAAPSPSVRADLERARIERVAAVAELKTRALALPVALVCARLAAAVAPGPVRVLAMWLHESGHAMAAWMCGYLAWPGPWFTPVGTEPSRLLTITLLGVLAHAAWRAHQAERRFWLAASIAGMLLVGVCTFGLRPGQAQQLIVFAGDGGSFVLGTTLMLTMFARPDHAVRREHLRWVFVAIGALAFMDAWTTWTGPIEGVPFGESDHGLSDPSVLVEEFGWGMLQLTQRYRKVAYACLATLALAMLAGIVVPAATYYRKLTTENTE